MRKILEAWSTLDPAKTAHYYAKDPGLPFYDIAPLKYAGWTEYAAGVAQIFAPFAALKLTATPDLQAHQMGSVGWGTATIHADVTKKNDTQQGLDARWTIIFEKRGSDWLVVHEHVSVPLPDEPAEPTKP
jgi:ketosteroid isomerase-like protein